MAEPLGKGDEGTVAKRLERGTNLRNLWYGFVGKGKGKGTIDVSIGTWD